MCVCVWTEAPFVQWHTSSPFGWPVILFWPWRKSCITRKWTTQSLATFPSLLLIFPPNSVTSPMPRSQARTLTLKEWKWTENVMKDGDWHLPSVLTTTLETFVSTLGFVCRGRLSLLDSLLSTVSIYASCPTVIINSTSFHSQNYSHWKMNCMVPLPPLNFHWVLHVRIGLVMPDFVRPRFLISFNGDSYSSVEDTI